MSTTWSHGQRPPANNGPRSGTNPPPVCFNCGQEGHYVVACPQPSRLNTGSFPLPPAPQQHPGTAPSPQGYQGGPPNGQYIPSNQPPQYGPPASYSYSQPPAPQTYGAPPNSGQYGPGYQPQPYGQYSPQNGMQQYRPPNFQAPPQQYGPPVSAMYPPPPNSFPPPDHTYRETYGAAPVPHYAPPHWNNTHPTPNGAPPYQRPQRTSSQGFHRENSGTPSQKSYQHTPRQESSSGDRPLIQQRSTSTTEIKYGPSQGFHGSPNIAVDESKSSSYGPAPSGGREGSDVAERDVSDLEKHSKIPGDMDNEALQLENEEQQFNWDFKYIFKEPQKAESVALAQPLSTTFDMTPVPQVDSKSTRSVSRYARNENLREFTRSIRAAPQWSYLQEDPAFSDVALEGPLIPVSEIPAWIEKRQGIVQVAGPEPTLETSRKRGWSEEQDELDTQLDMDTRAEIDDDSRAAKRQKNEEAGEPDDHMADKGIADSPEAPSCQTPVPETPVFARQSTPCLADVDDAWAPEPGEGATSPGDPTEALLASLGVTGSPKPVVDDPLPPYESSGATRPGSRVAESSRSQAFPTSSSSTTPPNLDIDGVHTNFPAESQASDRPIVPYSVIEAASQSGTKSGSQAPPQNLGFQNDHRDRIYNPRSHSDGNPGAPSNYPPNGAPRSVSWSERPPTNVPYGHQPHGGPPNYGPLVNTHHQSGPQPGYQSAPLNTHTNSQWGPLRSASYPNPQYDPHQFDSGPRPNVQYGATQQYGNGPPQTSQQVAQPQYNNESNPNQYNPPQYANPHYSQGHSQAPQQVNGPRQRYGGPQATSVYTSSHMPQGHQSNIPQNMSQYTLGPQHHEQHGNAPPRQDSGYMSAGGSFSNGPEESGFFPNPRGSQNSGQYIAENKRHGDHQPYSQEAVTKGQPEREHMQQRSSTSEEPGTPLSPTSAEILGKLVNIPSPSKKGETSRQVDDGGARKTKRPQPIVAEAYSRRW